MQCHMIGEAAKVEESASSEELLYMPAQKLWRKRKNIIQYIVFWNFYPVIKVLHHIIKFG